MDSQVTGPLRHWECIFYPISKGTRPVAGWVSHDRGCFQAWIPDPPLSDACSWLLGRVFDAPCSVSDDGQAARCGLCMSLVLGKPSASSHAQHWPRLRPGEPQHSHLWFKNSASGRQKSWQQASSPHTRSCVPQTNISPPALPLLSPGLLGSQRGGPSVRILPTSGWKGPLAAGSFLVLECSQV